MAHLSIPIPKADRGCSPHAGSGQGATRTFLNSMSVKKKKKERENILESCPSSKPSSGDDSKPKCNHYLYDRKGRKQFKMAQRRTEALTLFNSIIIFWGKMGLCLLPEKWGNSCHWQIFFFSQAKPRTVAPHLFNWRRWFFTAYQANKSTEISRHRLIAACPHDVRPTQKANIIVRSVNRYI